MIVAERAKPLCFVSMNFVRGGGFWGLVGGDQHNPTVGKENGRRRELPFVTWADQPLDMFVLRDN